MQTFSWQEKVSACPAGGQSGIYNTVMFFIERWDQIKAFCQAVMNSIKAVATGNIDGAKGWIEDSLGKAIPVTLGFLARLIGLGGIAEKIRKVIKKIRKPIDKAINKVVGGVAKRLKKMANKILGKGVQPKPGDAKKIKEENKTEKPDKVDDGDKKKHKEIAGKIKTKLKKNKQEDKEEFKEFHKRVEKEGEVLEDKYQPELKRGINLDVSFKSVKEDEKDGDIDYNIKIAPNTLNENDTIRGNENEDDKVDAAALNTSAILPNKRVTIDKEENESRGQKVIGYKGEADNKPVITVGAPGGNKFTKRVEDNNDHEKQYKDLLSMTPEKRRKKIQSSSTHNKFKPFKIKTEDHGDGKKITYTYEEGQQQFEVIVGKDGYPLSVKGGNLTLHDLGRGTTENPDGKKVNSGHDSAHLIANMFGGSGYKEAENLVATSAIYNQTIMAKTERDIADWIRSKPKAHHFSMKVDVKYQKPNESVEIGEIKKVMLKYAKDDEEKNVIKNDNGELEVLIKGKLEESGQPRVMGVEYKVKLYTESNKMFKVETFSIKEGDLLFGTKE